MNKTAIRNFAVWARNKLIADISYRAGLMGVTKDGIAHALPQSTNDVEFYDIGMAEPYAIKGIEIKQRKALANAINRKEKNSDYNTAYTSVVEEVAYTWFNRLIAVRFMEVNDYLPARVRVLSSESGKNEPDLVTIPFDADLELTSAEEQMIIQLKRDNKLDDLFRMLFIKQCNELHEILPRMFEKTGDYTELLLNISFVDQESVVWHLVHDIPEEDFDVERGGQVEIIGWLYQYYNAELKDETFALLKRNVKVTKERIPSATQLFTPDWIVRYMVENSLGRLWIEGHPDDSLKAGWKYYLDEAEQELEVQVQLENIRKEYADLNPEDIKVIDPCMGSGHILVYAFDVLMQIYENCGWSQRDAAKSIIENNLYGLDIDDRAAQLAYFAVMMKARQYNRRIFTSNSDCNICSIKESNSIDLSCLSELGSYQEYVEEIMQAFSNAKEYGSILKAKYSIAELLEIEKIIEKVDYVLEYESIVDILNRETLKDQVLPIIQQARIMSQKYDVVVTNPPYMGNANMDSKLATYVKDYYPDSKGDISTVCMEKALDMCNETGFMAMINIPVWMFLSSYEYLRHKIITHNTIVSMVHPGRGIFGSDFGSTSFVIGKKHLKNYIGHYRRLFGKQGEVESVEQREKRFLEQRGVYYSKQDCFSCMPSEPIAYWISNEMLKVFIDAKPLATYAASKQGLATADNNRFLRLWQEVNIDKVKFNASNVEDALKSKAKWFPYNKGGDFRKWYGNNEYLVNWENDGFEIKNMFDAKGKLRSRPQNLEYMFRESGSWSLISSSVAAFRFKPQGQLFDVGGMSFFSEDRLFYLLGLTNTNVVMEILKILAPTINYQCGDIANIPVFLDENQNKKVVSTVKRNVAISKEDWDSFETSWDFKKHPLI